MPLSKEDAYTPTLTPAKVEGGQPKEPIPSLMNLQQEVQKIWRTLNKLEGRVGVVQILDGMDVDGPMDIQGDLTVGGDVIGPVNVTGALDTSGDLAVGGNLSVAGGSTLTGATTQTAALTLMHLLAQFGIAAPAVSAAGSGRIYFDSGTNTFRVSQNGGAYANLVVPATTQNFTLLSINVTAVGNAAATLSNLMSYSVPGGTLANNGDFLLSWGFGTYAATANPKTVQTLFGATTVARNQSPAGGSGFWWQTNLIARTGATTQTAMGQSSDRSGGIGDAVTVVVAPGETLSGAVTLVTQGGNAAGAANDVIQTFFAVIKISL